MANPQVIQNPKVTDPSMSDLLNLHKKDIMLSFNCHAVATVQSFDADQQTVTATINYKKTILRQDPSGQFNTVLVDYPILLDVPMMMLGGGSCSLTFPSSSIVGAECLILFNDRDIDNWFQSGQNGPVASGRLHSFSDGFAFVGVRSMANVIDGYDADRILLANGTTLVGVGVDKVKIANQLYTLNGLLQNLVTEIKNLVTATAAITVTPGSLAGPSSPPLNAAVITAIAATLTTTATQIGDLLE